MTPKFPLTEAPTRDALLRGVEKLSRAVKETFGPSGRTIILDKKFGARLATKNGVTIAEEFELEDPDENAGAQFIREIAGSTSQTAGGGTTTATVLAEFIYKEGLRNVSAGANPTSLQRGIHKAVDAIVEELKRISKTVNDHTEIAQMATISAQWDKTIGEIIADAMDKVGNNGAIAIIDAKTTRTSLEIVKGTQFDKGYLSPYFITNSATMEVVLENPYIFIHGNKTLSLKDLLPLLEKITQAGASLLIIADDIENEALTRLIVNKIRGTQQVCAVKAPAFGDRRTAMLKDIAILTGARYSPDDLDFKIEKVKIEHLGRAKRIVVDKENTMIVGGSGSEAEIQKRAASIRSQIGEAADDYDRYKLEQRLAKLTGGVGLISVGAATETERNEKKARVEDALRATRAAAEEGVVLGGGVAFIRAQKALDQFKDLGGDEKVGVAIVRRALEEPSRQIANNAGHEGALIVQELKLHHGNVGYNVASGEYVDLFAAGIVDATKVTRSALQNAASISNLLLASETTTPREALSSEFEIGSIHTNRMSNDGGSGNGPPSPPIPPTFKSTDPAGPPPRYLVAKAEKSVKLGVPFILNTGIRTEAIPAAEGQGSSSVRGDVTGKLTIEIHAPDFISKDGTRREIDVPATGNSSWAAFELVASEKGVHTIDILAFKNSALLGAVTIAVGVGVESSGKNDAQNEMDVRDPETGEYTLKIVYEKGLKKYRFDLSSDTENLEPVYSDEPDENPQDIYTEILTNLNIQARNLNHLSANAQREWLESMGSILYKQFIPAKLKEALWKKRDQIRYLNILSKADPMPWELLYLRDEAGSSEGGFISNTATVTRWRWGTLAGRQLSRKSPYFVLPKGSLPGVEEEVQYLRNKVGAGEDRIVRELDDLLKLLETAQFSLLHFASHNITNPAVSARLYIPFGTAKFDITFMGKWTNTQFSAQRPLVFMNSCTSGGTVPLYKEMAGWADHFLGAGCGAFVGSLWEIRNESARKFAEKFYDEVTAGRNLGESMRGARKELGTSDPTYLAYTLYGHPLAKLL